VPTGEFKTHFANYCDSFVAAAFLSQVRAGVREKTLKIGKLRLKFFRFLTNCA
jgi:hypothetical protein